MLAMRCARGRPLKHRGYLGLYPAALGVTDGILGCCGIWEMDAYRPRGPAMLGFDSV